MNMTRVKYKESTFYTPFDYTLKDALDLGKVEWRRSFVEEYVDTGFPKWKRLKLSEFAAKPLKVYEGQPYSGNIAYKKSVESLNDDLFNHMVKRDFHGAHLKFTLMSKAFFNTGFFVEISGEGEFLAKYDLNENPNTVEISVIVVKKGAKATIVREVKGAGNFNVGTTLFLIEKGAKLDFFNILIAPTTPIIVNSNLYMVKGNADVEVHDVILGGERVASNHRFELTEEGAKSRLTSVYFESGKERADLQYELIHKAPRTEGKIFGNGVVSDESYMVFRGLTDIRKEAFGANAEENGYTLSLSPNARADAIPSLRVRNHSVNAKHAASTGSLDDDKLHYMMSRGLSRKMVLRLIVEGMFNPTTDSIPIDSVKRDVENELSSKI